MNAVDAVKSGHLSIRKAAIEFDVPKTTLHDTLKEKYQDAGMPGRKPALPVNIENRIANALKEASRQGMGVSRLQVMRRVVLGTSNSIAAFLIERWPLLTASTAFINA
jgi:hypothetical protein